jgi:hypothetical protein
VLQRTAKDAFAVKMCAAITVRTDVLISVAIAPRAMHLLDDLCAAKLVQMAVNGASSRFGITVDSGTQLLRGKLHIRIFRKKFAQPLSAGRLISFF